MSERYSLAGRCLGGALLALGVLHASALAAPPGIGSVAQEPVQLPDGIVCTGV